MKFVFNASTNNIGGGIQTATNFIAECLGDSTSLISWTFLVSRPIARNLESLGLNISDWKNFYVFDQSPARSRAERRRAFGLVKRSGATLVYTMSGPAYVKFPAFHVLGCSAPYVTHARWENYFSRGLLKGVYKLAESIAKLVLFHRADHLVFQTESSRLGFLQRGLWRMESTSVIPNAIGRAFTGAEPPTCKSTIAGAGAAKDPEVMQILIPAAYYSHKNLGIVVPTAKRLRNLVGRGFHFALTVPRGEAWRELEAKAAQAGVSAHIKNIGPFSVADAPEIYGNSALVFLPTRLETFSASYLEAMWCGLPIVTSNLEFAREICGEAAVYADTLNPEDCANAIGIVIGNKDVAKRLKDSGREQVQRYPTSDVRYQKIIDMLTGLLRVHANAVPQR